VVVTTNPGAIPAARAAVGVAWAAPTLALVGGVDVALPMANPEPRPANSVATSAK
jgi:hypothetical protein